jgi:hypothetical protein
VPGTLVECTPLNVQCQVQVCNETEQTCTTIASADGEPCDDGSACTVDDTCSGGECIGELLCDEPCEGCSDGVCYERCGVPLATEPGRQPKTVDALFIARAAVSLASCPLCVCDVNSSGRITASDGLATVRKAVGLNTLLVCPDHVSLVAGATSTTTSTSSTLVTDSTTTTTYY